jgi:hypothetical protein
VRLPDLQPPPSADILAGLPTAEAVRDRLGLLFTEASLLRSLLRLLERSERHRTRYRDRRLIGEVGRHAD